MSLIVVSFYEGEYFGMQDKAFLDWGLPWIEIPRPVARRVLAWTTKMHEKNKAVLYDPASLTWLLSASEVRVWVDNKAALVL